MFLASLSLLGYFLGIDGYAQHPTKPLFVHGLQSCQHYT